ncbi:VWA domain-containing protein [Evansella clarkii]|uniref:VWA domain-containing protein n=1 Tax=Evansella clarkii TaxID=79879 RepID=UPI0009974CDE|nr:VWA domain-containing protein [Evansella clarkii]
MRRNSLLILLSLSLVLAAGCTDSESNAVENSETNADAVENNEAVEESLTEDAVSEENDEQNEEEVYEIDLDYERFANDPNEVLPWLKLGPGKYSGEDYDETTARKEIDQWPDGLEPEQYFHYLLALTAEDYTEHQEFLEETEVLFNEISARPGDMEAGQADEEGKLHVQILLDASGSMAGQLEGRTKMELAKEAVADFAAELPEEANVSLRVYGHKGNNRADGKEESCGSTEEVYILGPYEEEGFSEALDKFEPVGFTPLAAAIKAAGEDLMMAHEQGVQSVIYVVSDGEETCGGDPVAEAEKLQDSDIEAVVNIIGFDIEASERAALEAIAEAGAGEYLSANTAQELRNTFEQERGALINEWYSWQSQNVNNAYSQQSEYVNNSYSEQSTAVNKSYGEQSRQKNLTYYMNSIMEDADTGEIRKLIDARSNGIREYFQNEHGKMREEAQEIGNRLREEVREKGDEEREKLRRRDAND